MKLEQAARQALEALELCGTDDMAYIKSEKAITALREALGQLNCQCGDKCFPIFSGDIEYCETCGKQTALAEQAEQEPVVKIHKYNEFQTLGSLNLPIGTKLYAAPVRTKDLTDDEIVKVTGCEKDRPLWLTVSSIARAVIAADREKNK